MSSSRRRLLAFVLPMLITSQLVADDKFKEQIEQVIRPLLTEHCAECHGTKTQKSSLRLDARHGVFRGGDGGPVIVPGNSSESELIRRIESSDPDLKMPPEGKSLSAEDIRTLRQWIDSGAEWPESSYDRDAARDRRIDHWAFQPVRNPMVPEVPPDSGTSCINEIDRFLLDALNREAVQPNPAADRRTLVRRAFLDLTGLPPTPEQVEAFVNDNSSDAWDRLIDQLLASPHYGERWAQHWLDVIRYADTHGFEVNTSRDNAWPYRDYVIRSLNEDKPYDQFIREQIAGDLFHEDAATGFLVASAVLLPGQIGADDASKRLARQDALDEIIVGTSNAILGITLGCCRCHDHKFDPLTQQDYYNFQSYFAGVEYGDRPLRDPQLNRQLEQAEQLRPEIRHLEDTLAGLEPTAFSGRTLILDEEDSRSVRFLVTPNGPGSNPEGTKRGYRDDPGASDRLPNLSRGRYTWWPNRPGEDVAIYSPGVQGTFRLWLSWGAHGSGVHTRDARYVLDQDGLPSTTSDQSEIATVDQYYPAGVTTGETEQAPLWSGLLNAGIVSLTPSTGILLRGGQTGTGITADVIVLQEVVGSDGNADRSGLPLLRSPVNAKLTIEQFSPVAARFVRFTTMATSENDRYEPCLDELEVFGPDRIDENLALASLGVMPSSSGNYSDIGIHQLKHINDGLYGNSHSWISNERGRGWVQLEWSAPVVINRIAWARDREGRFADRLPVQYDIRVSMDGTTWQTVAGSFDRAPQESPWDPVAALIRNSPGDSAEQIRQQAARLEELRSQYAQLTTPQLVFAGVFREPDQTWLLRRGDPEQKVSESLPALPALFSGASKSETVMNSAAAASGSQPATNSDMKQLTEDQRRRLSLASWLSSAENPLTARVIVNRLWQHHFGNGLTETPNDFGLNGAQPSHPELLDWLAYQLVTKRWSLKEMHRMMMRSAAYQRSAQIRDDAMAKDRDNKLVWRFTARRLESEAIRDSILFVTGELNLQAGGPGFGFFKSRGGLDGFPPVEQFTANEMRRMIYSHRVRMEPVPVFGAFDCPDAGLSVPKRSRSTTPLQALNLFNSRFMVERSDAFAARVSKLAPNDLLAQVEQVFRLAIGRNPTSDELDASVAVASSHGLSSVCRAVLNSSEFLQLP